MWASWATPTQRGSRWAKRVTAAPPTRQDARKRCWSAYPHPVGHQSCVASEVASRGMSFGQNVVRFLLRRKHRTSLVAVPALIEPIAVTFAGFSRARIRRRPAQPNANESEFANLR